MKEKIELGDEVRDSITGFQGVAIAKTHWISGCDRINVQPKIGKDGKLPDSMSFDEPMLVPVKRKKKEADVNRKIGGPRETIRNNKL